MEQLIKLAKKYLNMDLGAYDQEHDSFMNKNSALFIHSSSIIWQLKSKKLQPWEKKILKSYNEKPKTLSNSLKRGSISTKTRKIINERDNKTCQYCGSAFKPEIAHIVSRGAGGSGNDVNNLITLCQHHHKTLDNPIGFKQNAESKKIKEFIIKWKK